jgi:hypothetical protein
VAELKVQQAAIEAQRAHITAQSDLGPWLDKLFSANDMAAMVRLVAALWCCCSNGLLYC